MRISQRARIVLRQIVTLHYQTCEPVGSALVCRTRALAVSPATIRNIMARLENTGHLLQPHTSAGRLPTDLGYRTYVDDISLSCSALGEDECGDLEALWERTPATGPAWLKCLSDYIQRRTVLLTFHIPFRESSLSLKHIHFERISPTQVLVLWVAEGGSAYQSVVYLDENQMTQSMLEKAENFFNQSYRGYNLVQIQRNLVQQTTSISGHWDLLLSRATQITRELAKEADDLTDLQFQGLSTLLEMPEFQNIARMKLVFGLVDRPQRIKSLLHRAFREGGPWILFQIGSELGDPELDSLAVILARFSGREHVLGCVGAVGPKRLPYLKALQILSFAREKFAIQCP